MESFCFPGPCTDARSTLPSSSPPPYSSLQRRETSWKMATSVSRSNSGGGGVNPIRALGARISRVLSREGPSTSPPPYTSDAGSDASDRASYKSGDEYTPITTMSDAPPRARSRGRELVSTGRGGAGNIHRSLSRDELNNTDGGAAVPAPRGREPNVGGDVTHVGRGGAGNVRSPSGARDSGELVVSLFFWIIWGTLGGGASCEQRTALRCCRPKGVALDAARANYEHKLIEQHDENPYAFSTGRGGAGNIKTPEQSRSRSRGPSADRSAGGERSQSRGRVLHSSGRGGAGNISSVSDFAALEEEEDAERLAHAHAPDAGAGVHSTGRGGLANVTTRAAPPPEASPARPHSEGVFSMGRGGAGNIRERSASRAPEAGGEQQRQSQLGKIIDRVKGHASPHAGGPGGEERRASLERK
ncbi:hypothetical protein DFH11DRAFT_1726493 [Phellopilus nigrolimitatus]|nr:hypothetical protein DFH11DRAFT_1726493 [Phellopilus nigrolimitatus]